MLVTNAIDALEPKAVLYKELNLPPLSDVSALWSSELSAEHFHLASALRTNPLLGGGRELE